MSADFILQFFITTIFAVLCTLAGREILHLFRVKIDDLNVYLKVAISIALAEISAIFLLNIFLKYISYRAAGWLLLGTFLGLAVPQLISTIRKPRSMRVTRMEIVPGVMLVLVALPAFYGLCHTTIGHIELKYLLTSYIRNNGLPLIEQLPDNSWIIHNYHYGPELIVAVLSPLAPLYDCAGFVALTRIPGAIHIATYVLMLYGVIAQLLPAVAAAWRCVIAFFVLYYGGNTLLIYLAYSDLSPAAFVNESLIPPSRLIAGWCNPLVRSVLNDSLIVAFRGWETSFQHLLVLLLPVMWVLTVNMLAKSGEAEKRENGVFFPSVLLIGILSTALLVHEEVAVYVVSAGLVYLFYKTGGGQQTKKLFVWAALMAVSVALFALLQGGTLSHLFYSHITGNKSAKLLTQNHPASSNPEHRDSPNDARGDFKGIVNDPPKQLRLSPNPALIGYGVGRMSLIKNPWKMLVHHGIDYFILIPVAAFYLLRRMKREPADFSGVLDFWILMAVPMAFFSLFFRIAGQDFLCERFNKIELAALTILMLFFWMREKARPARGKANTVKYGIFCLVVALVFASSTTRSIFYYVTLPKAEFMPIREYCAEHVNKFVNDSR